MFKIDSLEIRKNKEANMSLYKNLKPGLYPFHSIESSNLWGAHVNIQAIVGKNGSGKSSLMDVLYMAINNFAYMFERGHHRAAATSLCYVKGLYVNVNYSLDDVQYVLSCDGDSTKLIRVNTKKTIANFHLNSRNATREEINDDAIRTIVKSFFYTIVSNYSMQSFISSNYACDTNVYNIDEHRDDVSENVNSFGRPWDDNRDGKNDSKEKIWLNSIFHKNDGYVRSITLNPYRDNGVINMEKEKKLAKYRLIALLIDGEKSKTNIFRDYALDRITFSLDEDFLKRKFPKYSIEKLITSVINQLIDKDSVLLNIVKSFNLEIDFKIKQLNNKDFDLKDVPESIKLQLIALAYLQKKMEKIIENYESYKLYRINEKLSIYDTNNKNRKNHLKDLCKHIKEDSSHVVTKIKQTINFLSCKKNNLFEEKEMKSKKWLDKEFTYRRYCREGFVRSYASLDEIIASFPPPIFKYEVYLNRIVLNDTDKYKKQKNYLGCMAVDVAKSKQNLPKEAFFISTTAGLLKTKRNGKERNERFNKGISIKWNGKYWKRDEINLSELSSGELQMMHTLSTHAYHIRNIMSVKNDTIKYHSINMVFDEVEICFHPEYQRQFISRLLAMLNALCRFEQNYNFNIFILTHSPFILSDIPSSNILYMGNGQMLDKNKYELQETFAQNVSVLLNQSFFMNCFIGDFAKNKIAEIIDDIMKKKKTKQHQLETRINMIGDEFIKSQMKKRIEKV